MKELFWFQKELSEEEGMGTAASPASQNASPNLQNHPQLYWEMANKNQLWVLLMSARVLAAGRQLAMPISHTLGQCSPSRGMAPRPPAEGRHAQTCSSRINAPNHFVPHRTFSQQALSCFSSLIPCLSPLVPFVLPATSWKIPRCPLPSHLPHNRPPPPPARSLLTLRT